jgi:hypothetical protein
VILEMVVRVSSPVTEVFGACADLDKTHFLEILSGGSSSADMPHGHTLSDLSPRQF